MKKLNKIEFVSALTTLLFFATLSSCGKVDDALTANVTIKMPDLTNQSSQSVSAKMNSSVSTPLQLSDVNCYAVMVGGPAAEANLNRTRCEIVTTTTVSGTTVETVIENRNVGMIRGLVPSNGVISLDVPSGSDRVFSLVGFKASPITSCVGFNDANVNLDLISDPVLLGTTTGVNLTGGVTNNVIIQMQSVSGSIANNHQIGECYGPDNPGSSKIVPTQAVLTKNNFPSNILVANQCNSIDVEFVDNAGRMGDIPYAGFVRLSHDIRDASGTSIAGLGGQGYDLYNSFNDCNSSVNATDYIPIVEKSRSKQIWLRAVSETAVYYDFDPHVTASATAQATQILTNVEKTFKSYPSSTLALEIAGTQKVLPDTCYKMSAVLKTLTNSVSPTSYRYKVEHPVVNGVADVGATLYTATDADINCFNSNLLQNNTVTSSPVAASDRAYFFIKYSSGSGYRKTSFSLTPVVSGVSATNQVKSTYQVEVIDGSKNPSRIAVMGPNQLVAGTCPTDRVYKAIVVNEKWTALPASATITLASTLKSGTGSLYIANTNLSNPCPSSTLTATGTTSFSNNSYSFGFYAKPGTGSSGVFTITATAAVSGPLGASYTLPPSTFDIYVSPP